jgi:hypothetical protein
MPAIALLLGSAYAHAEGSVTFEDADRFLKEAPDLRDHLLATLCISENGMATRLAGDSPLGGERIGPYEFVAWTKGSDGHRRFTLTINTHPIGYDRDGRALRGDADRWVGKAARIDETFASVTIEPLRGGMPVLGLKSVNCPDDASNRIRSD